MPDRPKRRKNNKNKRKNKNQRPDPNIINSDVNKTVSDTCSDQNSAQSSSSNVRETKSKNESNPKVLCNETESSQCIDDIISNEVPCSTQDLNNNSDEVQVSGELIPSIVLEQNGNDSHIFESYVVESPENSLKSKCKLDNKIKSKSLDNDDAPKIVELSDEPSQSEDENTLAIIESSNVLVSDVESDVEWEKIDEIKDNQVPSLKEIATGTLSVATIPLNVAQCDQTKALTPEAERSLRNYLKTLNLSTNPTDPGSVEIKTEIEHIINREIRHRLRKRGLADDFLGPRLGPPRMLDVIDEEGSGESSASSRRQSHLIERKSDIDDLDDDVFVDDKKVIDKYSTKSITLSAQRQIPQKCMLVGAKIKEPAVTEARGDWSVKTVEKMTGAEIVYLTDSSSSTSSIHDYADETDDGMETDVSVRIITPTIEVTDTESLLKKSFIPKTLKGSHIDASTKNVTTNSSELLESVTGSYENNLLKECHIPSEHEIVVLSTDNIKTNLYVKDIEEKDVDVKTVSNESNVNSKVAVNPQKEYDIEMKVLKCELNDAINNLIKEVSSDSESTQENQKESYTRQDSSSSVGSSQCTAKYNPNYSSLNDVSNMHDEEICDNNKISTEKKLTADSTSHVKDVFDYVTGTPSQTKSRDCIKQPSDLRDLCVKRIASLPYGEKILEELASVSKRLQNITIFSSKPDNFNDITVKEEINTVTKMPYYPLPDVSSIETVALETRQKDSVPPPLKPRNSSLKKGQDDHWTGVPTKTEPVYVCLSPSQKMLMEKTNTVITKEDASQLVDMHKKYIDRRGYNEYKKADREKPDNPPIVPFKSQTGSRLLALIRDPNVTTNINTSMSKHYNHSLDHIEKSTSRVEKMSKRIQDQFNSIKDFSSSFKPIPPPRPRKYSSSFYESDESSDFTDSSFRSMKSERKFFHYSTGNLNKEIENDVSTIQNMHRYCTNLRDQAISQNLAPRRPSLPKDLCDQQMEYIRQKEKEVEAEIRRLEEMKLNATPTEKRSPRAPLISEKEEIMEEKFTDKDNYYKLHKKDFVVSTNTPAKLEKGKVSSLFSSSQEEIQRDKMYSEYMNQMAQRQERKQQKIIKITNYPATDSQLVSKSMSALDALESKVNNRIEKEFICKARERWEKLGIKDPETEDERESGKDVYTEPKVIEHKIKVIEGNKEKDVQKLPNHLQDFVRFTAKDKEQGSEGSETVMIAPTFKARSTSPAVWRPGAPTPPPAPAPAPAPAERSPGAPPPPPPPPIWSPGSAGPSPQGPRKNFRPVHFEETPPARRKFGSSEQNGCTSGSESEGRLRTSLSAPATGLHSLGSNTRLPRAQNPTVTLLQKAREGQIPRGANYLQQERDGARLPRDRPSPPRGDPVHALRKEYASEGEADRSDYERGTRKMADAHRKVEGIGPTTKEGMPVALRSEVKDPSRWYKKMYDTIHKNKYDDDYVTIRYKSRRGEPPKRVTSKSQYAYFDPRSGYLSEPEGGLSRLGSSTWSDAYDSDVTTGPRRRTASVQEDRKTDITSPYLPSNKYSTLASARASQEVYKNQPGRIEDYVPGKSSVVDKEAKQWWDEVMDIFDGWLDENSPLPPYTTLLARAIQKSQNISSTTSLPQASPKEKKDITSAILSKSNMARALKESGYESDSTLVFRRREDTEAPLSPAERRAAYRDLQAGGEPPLRGFRSPAPPRQDESEIEYIPISSTLTKIRVHKKTPKLHEVICYPVTSLETDAQNKFKKRIPSFSNVDVQSRVAEYPPAPPRRVSSKNSRTLKLVTSTRPVSTSPKRSTTASHSNVDFLRNKISNKLTRQNTHIITKRGSVPDTKSTEQKSNIRVMSISAPPAINRKNLSSPKSTIKSSNESKSQGTSSFGSPRRTLLPTEYNSIRSKYGDDHQSVVLEGGAGRRTPISNILDKVTSLDKLWSSEKRNERIDLAKAKSKSAARTTSTPSSKLNSPKPLPLSNVKSSSPVTTHKSRDMIRTSEKVNKIKISNIHAKSNPCLAPKLQIKSKPIALQSSSNISKSSLNIPTTAKKQNNIKTAIVTNLKKKKSLDNVILRPRSVPCHESCSKKSKDAAKTKKVPKVKSTKKATSKSSNDSECGSQFGDTSNEPSNFGSFENLRKKVHLNSKEIERTRDAVVSDSFFQHLFLGNTNIPTISCSMIEPNTTVMQKAKMFQSYPQDNVTPKSINSYLIHRKPVSLSRFKMWDRYPTPVRAQSPRSVSWPGRTHKEVRKFDSLLKRDDFGSSSSLATVRSKSEPPVNKIYFSQTSRPRSPTVIFHKRRHEPPIEKEPSPSRLIFSQTSRPVSPKVTHKIQKTIIPCRNKSQSPARIVFTETVRPISPTVTRRNIPPLEVIEIKTEEEKYPTLFFSQTSRPVSPKVVKKTSSQSRSQSTSPVSVRSPSYRRIYNVKQNKHPKDSYVKCILRTRSAGDADTKIHQDNLSKTKSDSNLRTQDPEYEEYIQDMQNSKIRSERFRELNRYYAYLERVAELEKTTSTCDLRHRRKDEEIIDFDRWKKIRAIERAEEELNNLYYKLKIAQNEKDVLFYPRDVKDFRWNYDKDRGLRVKEKSVEDLKDHFQQIPYYDVLEIDNLSSKDTYKPLWRGTSVAETAFNINRKNESEKYDQRAPVRPVVTLHQDSSLSELRRKIGLGNRLWSSLSMEQVNALKNQLNAIYSKELESKSNKESENFVVDVKHEDKGANKPGLHVRCNSLITPPYSPLPEKDLCKSESIAAISCPITSVKELKNNVNKIQMSLSENEKRKISQTISKEVLDRINKFDSAAPLTLKQEIENIQLKQVFSENKDVVSQFPKELTIEVEAESKKKTDYAKDENERHLVYPTPEKVEKTETQYQSSASETETASSDVSNKTVIYREPKKEVQKKVEYFESVKNMLTPSKTVYHAREGSDEKVSQDQTAKPTTTPSGSNEIDVQKNPIIQSQSCANFKELFGESERNKFLSLPTKPELHSRSPSPHSEVYVAERRTPDTLRYSSDETIWRSRSPSPDPERYWRAYLNLARAGEVRRLARRFDSPSAAGAVLRRHRSDPELTRDKWSFDDRFYMRRDRSRNALPVARIPLRQTNRYMPHIDIISKLATLRRRTAPRSRSAEEPSECRIGEVDRIRRRFEAMSILGQIYASAPDVSELRDIAPYLAGPWIAHRYPKKSDNNRSITEPTTLIRGRTSPVRKEIKRMVSKEPVKLSSILKSDAFAKQEFDPSVHRPASRYEPPRAPPRPPPASWPYRLAPFVMPSRHTVTFQETDSAPEPPRRTPHGSLSDTESPRRYVESDVNIHYRCPVRHDPLPLVPERELARQQAEHMKRLYREQKRNKYLQELQDMQSRRHQDNFLPSQKNILPLNRYDETERVVARALYAFNGQTARELSFRKGDIIHVRRQIDANWYEGELHGRIGLFPYNYIEIVKGDAAQSPRKPAVIEGRARAKFDFTAQTNLELPLKKGELVVLTRRIDHNWWEGRLGNKTGIFPDSYVTILQEPSQTKHEAAAAVAGADKPAASPAAHGLVNGAARRSLAAHSYTPQLNSPALSNAPPATQPLPGYVAKPAQATLTPSERGYGPPAAPGVDLNNREPLYVDTNAEAVPYRAMYKYRPQNPDELELNEGDTVYVLEQCDDGWYVGSSQRTGRFGTFPGNYVERI
ncbi:uncharacterized protein LOC126369484 isoform X4 [Pectinophora gossypiella]|uniref:uncharacterized protein LOC126369484 isoform X4 n=1 Tax=Pectinophora gossypiella TaxID=13191 RepID=UPI00214E3223|nr:uncharacterized protein LOC126369484 isoform X4 [Pectinophora gossypiella]